MLIVIRKVFLSVQVPTRLWVLLNSDKYSQILLIS